MNRRGFIGSILALGAAPAIVRADSLMRVIDRDTSILVAGAADLGANDMLVITEWRKDPGGIWTAHCRVRDASGRERLLETTIVQRSPPFVVVPQRNR